MAARTRQACLRAALAPLLLLLPLLNACGSTDTELPPNSLLAGSRAPIPAAQLDRAIAVAHRFAAAYARSLYSRRLPPLPGASAEVTATLRAAAAHVPTARRRRHPRAGHLRLEPRSATHLHADLTVLDGRSPSFSVGFELSRRGAAWLITSISPPG